MSVALAEIVEAIERDGDVGDAVARLAAVEARSFLDGRQAFAAEVGFARYRLEGGDRPGALAVLRRLVERAGA